MNYEDAKVKISELLKQYGELRQCRIAKIMCLKDSLVAYYLLKMYWNDLISRKTVEVYNEYRGVYFLKEE